MSDFQKERGFIEVVKFWNNQYYRKKKKIRSACTIIESMHTTEFWNTLCQSCTYKKIIIFDSSTVIKENKFQQKWRVGCLEKYRVSDSRNVWLTIWSKILAVLLWFLEVPLPNFTFLLVPCDVATFLSSLQCLFRKRYIFIRDTGNNIVWQALKFYHIRELWGAVYVKWIVQKYLSQFICL